MANERERTSESEPRPTARLQLVLEPDKVGWLHAALLNQPQVDLYSGKFIDPFDSLVIVAARRQNQLVLTAALELGETFTQNHGETIGTPEILTTLTKRYPEFHFSDDDSALAVSRRGQITGVIQRDEGHIIIQCGGNAGQITLSDKAPVNDLQVEFEQFSLLVQRYVSAIWRASDGNQRQTHLVLNIPAVPQEAADTYFSTFEIVGREFVAHHRLVDLSTDIGGFRNVKNAIRSIVLDFQNPDLSRRFGTQPLSNHFILITGDEGTGKSLFVKALDGMMSTSFKGFEHYRLPVTDILQKYGAYSRNIVGTVLGHVRENEKKGIKTALHLDSLHTLCPPENPAAYMQYSQMVAPIIQALRDFGQELGPASKHVVVVGESRVSRESLPEGIQRTFRRAFHLQPTRQDLAEALEVQIALTRSFAAKSGIDPVDPNVDRDLTSFFSDPYGLTGRDVQHVMLNIIDRNKASGLTPEVTTITREDIANELLAIQTAKGREASKPQSLGFKLPR